MGHIFFLCPPAVRGSLTLGWRGLCHSRGAVPFFLMPLMYTGGRGFPRPPPRGCPTPASWDFLPLSLPKGGIFDSPTCT